MFFQRIPETADDYVEQIRRNAEQEIREIKEAAELEAAEIIRKAREQSGTEAVQAPAQSAAEAEPGQLPEQPAAAAIAQFEFPKTAYAAEGLMQNPAAFEGEKEYAG